MIIRGGENLYPREIEEFYLTTIGESTTEIKRYTEFADPKKTKVDNEITTKA